MLLVMLLEQLVGLGQITCCFIFVACADMQAVVILLRSRVVSLKHILPDLQSQYCINTD
jgi:hypothetical protein